MKAKREKRRGMIAFGLIVVAALVLLAIIVYATDSKTISSLLSQTHDVDSNGYLSEYEARLGVQAQRPTPTDDEVAAIATPTTTESADRNIATVAPVQPRRPSAAR